MSNADALTVSKNLGRNGIQDRMRERIKELSPEGIIESRARWRSLEKKKRIATYNALKACRLGHCQASKPLPSAPYAPAVATPLLVEDARFTITSITKDHLGDDGDGISQEEEENSGTVGDEDEQVEMGDSVQGHTVSCCGYTGLLLAAFVGTFIATVLVL